MTSPVREKKLSERLLAVASMVDEAAGGLGLSAGAARVVDIGTDHAYLPIFLIRQGIAGHVIAADVNDGPLERARQHVEEAGLAGQITLRLSDGFAAIEAGEADIAVLSGMGGRLMKKLIETCPPETLKIRQMILQPQSEARDLWGYLNENGWDVVDERMVYEDNKFYTMMRVCLRGDQDVASAGDFGSFLSAGRDEAWHLFLKKEQNANQALMEELSQKNVPEKRMKELEAEQANIESALSVFADEPDTGEPEIPVQNGGEQKKEG